MSDALRLFLVEDDDDVAFVTRRCLERAGHQVMADVGEQRHRVAEVLEERVGVDIHIPNAHGRTADRPGRFLRRRCAFGPGRVDGNGG